MELSSLTPEELGNLFPIHIVPFDRDWARQFCRESLRIKNTLGENIALRIEHFGSTSVPGLAAKPTIDILIEIPPLTETLKEQIIEKMVGIGYTFIWRTDEEIPYIHFVKGYSIRGFEKNVFHIHMGGHTHPLWDRLFFRDYLRNNKAVAEEYAVLKGRLAEKFRNDREAYTLGKGAFVRRITQLAKQQGANRPG